MAERHILETKKNLVDVTGMPRVRMQAETDTTEGDTSWRTKSDCAIVGDDFNK